MACDGGEVGRVLLVAGREGGGGREGGRERKHYSHKYVHQKQFCSSYRDGAIPLQGRAGLQPQTACLPSCGALGGGGGGGGDMCMYAMVYRLCSGGVSAQYRSCPLNCQS